MSDVGYTAGVFDLFHIGHLRLLQRAKDHCETLIVGVTTDELASEEKGRAPLTPFAERSEILASLSIIDRVVPQVSYDKMEAWRNLKFHKMFVGDDWKGSDRWNKLETEMGQVGVEIVYFPYFQGTSSTVLRERLARL
jgi:glycerol-3-phosphate cytidylyltransferase